MMLSCETVWMEREERKRRERASSKDGIISGGQGSTISLQLIEE